MIKAKILILDFDGLLVDSAPECWLRCVDACQMDTSLKDSKFTDVDKNTFLRMRYLVGPAHEFYFLMRSLVECTTDSDIERNFKELLKGDDKNALKYKGCFFNSRVLAQNKNMKSWIESNNFFYPALSMAKKFSDSGKLYIATMKDEESVLKLLEYNDICCDKSKVLGRRYGDDKYSHISYVIDQNPTISRDEFLFMDDNIRHINEIKSLGVRSMLVTWGYGTKSSINYAKKNQIKTIDLVDCNKVIIDE